MSNWRNKLNWQVIHEYIYNARVIIPDDVKSQLVERFGDRDYDLDINDYSTRYAIRNIRKELRQIFQDNSIEDVGIKRIYFLDLDSSNPYHAGALYNVVLNSYNEEEMKKIVDILQNDYGVFDPDLSIDEIIHKRKA